MSKTPPTPPPPEGRIGYIVKGFPRLSEAFISNEIALLERFDLGLHLFVLKQEQPTQKHAVIEQMRTPITYLPAMTALTATPLLQWLWDNVPQFLSSHVTLLGLRPRAYGNTLVAALAMSMRYRSRRWGAPKKTFFKEFLQAGAIALEVLRSGTIRHLHAHFAHGSATIAMMASQLSGVPFSFTAHAKDIYVPKLNPRDLLPRKLRCARFVVTCTDTNNAYLQQLCLDGAPIHTVYHGLDTALFAPAAREYDPEHIPLILAVGRFVAKKGFPYLVQACHLLHQQGEIFRCRIIGEPDEQTEIIQAMIRDLGLTEVISLHPAVPHEALHQIYQEAAIFALPCQIVDNGDRDGIPNVLAEAMAMELPVVSTSVTGIPELVDHGVDGLLVPQRDAAALAAALATFLHQPALRQQFGKAARDKVCRIFDARKNTVALRQLFATCLETSGMSPQGQ